MRNLTIKSKLICMVVGFSLVMLSTGLLGLHGMNTANKALKLVYEENVTTVETLAEITGLMRENRVQLLLALQHDPRNKWNKMHNHAVTFHTDQVMKNLDEIKSLWKAYCQIPRSAEEKMLAESFDDACARVIKDGMHPVREAALAGEFDEAFRLTLQVLNPSYVPAKEAMTKLVKNESVSARRWYGESIARYNNIRIMIVAGILVALLGGAMANYFIIRSICRATRNLADVSARLADGDLTARVVCEKGDELGEMGDSFNRMGDALSSLIGKLNGNVFQLNFAAGQLYATADETATGTGKIADQIESVATASEEMAATSIEIAHNCMSVAESSKQASAAALKGSAVVQESVSVMNRISDRVKETARTVDGLGARSDQIGEIVGTIEILPTRQICSL